MRFLFQGRMFLFVPLDMKETRLRFAFYHNRDFQKKRASRDQREEKLIKKKIKKKIEKDFLFVSS